MEWREKTTDIIFSEKLLIETINRLPTKPEDKLIAYVYPSFWSKIQKDRKYLKQFIFGLKSQGVTKIELYKYLKDWDKWPKSVVWNAKDYLWRV